MKKITRLTALPALALGMVLALPATAQEMPPGGVLVNTGCMINEGHSLAEVLETARGNDYGRENAPNLVFYRRPIAAANAPSNFLLRVVYWDNLEHWARSGATGGNPTAASTSLNAMLDCDNANRSFFINRNVGGAGNAYAGGENPDSMAAARFCELKSGNTIEDVYFSLEELTSGMRAAGDQSTVQLSNRFLGPREGQNMGTGITIRLVGESSQGLAARIDMMAKGTLSEEAPVINCQDMSLWSSHVIHWGL